MAEVVILVGGFSVWSDLWADDNLNPPGMGNPDERSRLTRSRSCVLGA